MICNRTHCNQAARFAGYCSEECVTFDLNELQHDAEALHWHGLEWEVRQSRVGQHPRGLDHPQMPVLKRTYKHDADA